MLRSVQTYHYRESGLQNVWIDRCTVLVCSQCETRLAILPDASTAAREIVRSLVLQTRKLNGQEIVFIRRSMRLKARELATALKVHRVAVSRWENDQVEIDEINDYRLRLKAVRCLIAASTGVVPSELVLRISDIFVQGLEPTTACIDTRIVVPSFEPKPDSDLDEPLWEEAELGVEAPAVGEL